MSYLDRIAACNTHDPSRYVPFRIRGVGVGALRRDHLDILANHPAFSVDGDTGVTFAEQLTKPAEWTAALNEVTRDMCDRGICDPWRDEPYPVGTRFGEVLCEVARPGAELFGITAYGVHLTGFVRDDEGLKIWVPRRSADRPTYPGQLDNTVAGGQPSGLSVLENLVKECDEEAGLPRGLVEKSIPVGTISYTLDGRVGRKQDVIFNYDLEIPPDTVPVNQDGEVGDFELWPVERALETIAETADFKFNCSLVLIDFFIRHGLIAPDHPDYVALCTSLNLLRGRHPSY
jgi:isopentenyldiphosphate isomerase